MKHALSVWGTLLMVLVTLVSSCQKEVLLPIEEGASHKSSKLNTTVTTQTVTLPTEFCGNTTTGDLMTNGGSSTDIGDYEIFNDETNLYVVITTTHDQKNFHVEITDCIDLTTNYGSNRNNLNSSHEVFAYPLAGLPSGTICMKVSVNNGGVATSGNFNYTIQYCCELSMDDLGIIGHGGWGSIPQGNNPGAYLDANYSSIAPITIGCVGNSMPFADADAISTYQRSTPQGTPGVLPNEGVFGKQVMALALNIAFDDHDANFSASDLRLGDLVVANGLLAGKTVDEVLAIANDILGGCSSAYTPSAINDIVSAINDKVEGFLTCPN